MLSFYFFLLNLQVGNFLLLILFGNQLFDHLFQHPQRVYLTNKVLFLKVFLTNQGISLSILYLLIEAFDFLRLILGRHLYYRFFLPELSAISLPKFWFSLHIWIWPILTIILYHLWILHSNSGARIFHCQMRPISADSFHDQCL